MIKIQSLQKIYSSTYSNYTALDNVDLLLPNIGFVAIYGENGCGKTTLLNLLSTIDTDYSGNISYNEMPYRGNEDYLRRNVVSYVFQDDYFVNYLDVNNNLKLFCENEDEETIKLSLEKRKIPEKIHENPNNLSGGQKQRTSFIRGVTKYCDVLLVDEPTSSLNEEMETLIFEEMKVLSQTKLVLLVSHNLSLIKKYCDLIIHMDKAKIANAEQLLGSEQIEYHDNYISLPSIDDLHLIDRRKASEIFNTKNELLIKKCQQNMEKPPLSYEVEPQKATLPPKKLSKGLFKSIIRSSVAKDKSSLFLMGIFVSLVGALLSCIFSFYNFDYANFTYESLNRNDEYVFFKHDGYESDEQLSREDYVKLKNLGANPIVIYNAPFIELEFSSIGLYRNNLCKTAYCSSGDFNILEGAFPADNESIMLTDYTADGIIKGSGEYDSYSDILANGVLLNSIHINVSAIADTDYEKYIPLYDDPNFNRTKSAIDYDFDTINRYAVMYYSYVAVENADYISNLPLNNGRNFADAFSIDAYNSENGADLELTYSSNCFINTALSNILQDNDKLTYIKLKNDALEIQDVIDDGSLTPRIYTMNPTLASIKSEILHEITELNAKLTSKEVVKLLLDSNYRHETSASSYITDTITIVSTLKRLFVILLVIIIGILFGVVCYDVNKMLKKQQTTLAFMKLTGYERKNTLQLTMVLCAIRCAAAVVLSCLLFVCLGLALNAGVSSAFNAKVALINIGALTIIMTTIAIIAAYAISWILMTSGKLKTDIILLLKKTSN